MITGWDGTGPSLLAFVSNLCCCVNCCLAHLPAGPQLKVMLERAWNGARTQREVADSMTLTWSEFVPGWRRMLDAYKKDKSKPNPFQEPDLGKGVSARIISYHEPIILPKTMS